MQKSSSCIPVICGPWIVYMRLLLMSQSVGFPIMLSVTQFDRRRLGLEKITSSPEGRGLNFYALREVLSPKSWGFHVSYHPGQLAFLIWLLNYDFGDSIFRSRSTWPRSQRGQRSPLNPNFWRAHETMLLLINLLASRSATYLHT